MTGIPEFESDETRTLPRIPIVSETTKESDSHERDHYLEPDATIKRSAFLFQDGDLDVFQETMRLTALQEIAHAEQDHMESSDDLIQKSIRGTQGIMIAIIIGVPLGFFVNTFIGRIFGATGLGYYALLQIVVTTIQTFFLFGGSNVIINFIPRESKRHRSAFIASYIGIALIFSIIFLGLMFAFPKVLSIVLLHTPITAGVYLFLIIFMPIVIGQTLTIALLQGEMEVGAAARAQYSVQTVSFVLTIAAAIATHFMALPILQTIGVIVAVAYFASFGIGLLPLIRIIRSRWQFSLRWYMPTKFWRFTATVHIHTIVTFFLNSADQLFIVYYFHDPAINGVFRAAIAVATYALWAPNLFTGAMYPLFTHLIARKDIATLKMSFQRYSAITGIIVATFGITVGLFATAIIRLYGHGFGQQSIVLLEVFAAMYVLIASSAFIPTGALITAYEDVWINLTMNTITLVLRIALYSYLVQRYGLLGIAIANAISLVFLHMGTLLIATLRYHIRIPLRQHMISIIGCIILMGYYGIPVSSHTIRVIEPIMLFLLYLFIVLQLRIISREDLIQLSRRISALRFLQRLFPQLRSQSI